MFQERQLAHKGSAVEWRPPLKVLFVYLVAGLQVLFHKLQV